MSDLAMLVYLAEILPRVGGVSVLLAFICIGYPFIYMMGTLMGDFKKSRAVAVTLSCITALLFTGIAIAIPTKTTIYLMAGGEVASRTAEAVGGTAEMDKIRAIINVKLDGMLETPAVEEETDDGAGTQ